MVKQINELRVLHLALLVDLGQEVDVAQNSSIAVCLPVL